MRPDVLRPHYPAKVRRVIYLFMAGAPSQLELFDHKPKLVELEGKPLPPSVIEGQRYAFIQPDAAVLSPRFPFARHGECGAELSDRLPHLAKVVDDIAISSRCIPISSTMRPRRSCSTRGVRSPAGPAWGRGSVTESAARLTTCRGSSSSRAAVPSAAGRPCGVPAFSRRRIRGCRFVLRGIPFCMCRIRRDTTSRRSAKRSTSSPS